MWPDADGHETDVLGVGVDESDECNVKKSN